MAKKRKKSRKQKKLKSGRNRTPISGHLHVGKELLPPFAKLGDKVVFSSWVDHRLPEMLWAILIRAIGSQQYAINQFWRVLNFIGGHSKREALSDITHTGIAKLDTSLREEFISMVIEPLEIGSALSTLRLFQGLPAQDIWYKLLPEEPLNLDLLMSAVGATLWHQSQSATDCRWLRVMVQVVSGKFHIPKEMAEEWFGYPDKGDQRKVRPSIRAAEIAPGTIDPPDLNWAKSFWDEAWRNTPCFRLSNNTEKVVIAQVVTRNRINEIMTALEEHWEHTHVTTEIDTKHDAIFGTTFYSLRLLDELMGLGVGTGIIGRIGLRSILEIHINLRYLLRKDDMALWKKWRTFGAGQAKLNALRFDENLEPPKYIDVESIERIANEDIWEELLTISIGSWSGHNLRKLSENAGLKDTYDKYYSWTSGYVHGTWGPVREACYQTCANPLHRLHRYPERRLLPDTVNDAAELVDEILGDLDKAYPSFPLRILGKKADT